MPFLRTLGRYLGLRATKAELLKLTDTVRAVPNQEVYLVFDAFSTSKEVLERLLTANYQHTFRRALALDLSQMDDKLRSEIAILGAALTTAQKQFNEPMHAFGVYFWRVVLMGMIYPELYESGRNLWKAVAARRREYVEGRTRFLKRAVEGHAQELGRPAMSVEDAVAQEPWLLTSAPKYYAV